MPEKGKNVKASWLFLAFKGTYSLWKIEFLKQLFNNSLIEFYFTFNSFK